MSRMKDYIEWHRSNYGADPNGLTDEAVDAWNDDVARRARKGAPAIPPTPSAGVPRNKGGKS
jgi:hypothetical protein